MGKEVSDKAASDAAALDKKVKEDKKDSALAEKDEMIKELSQKVGKAEQAVKDTNQIAADVLTGKAAVNSQMSEALEKASAEYERKRQESKAKIKAEKDAAVDK